MKKIPLLPIAPRPYPGEMLSSWQARVACRYGCVPNEIEHWLGYEDTGEKSGGFERRDFRADPAVLKLWARAARLEIDAIDQMVLSRSARPVDWYVADRRERGLCTDCLDEDISAGRDHYLRREWAHVETVICRKHRRMLQDFCDRCFARGRFRFQCIEEKARFICGQCATAVSNRWERQADPVRLNFLLAVTGAIEAAVTGKEDIAALNEITDAVQVLWAPSQENGKPFIAWANQKLPFGRASVFGIGQNSLSRLSLAWRVVTLTVTAQLLDLAGARQQLGSPPWFIERELANRKRSLLPQPAKANTSERPEGTASECRLRPDAEYHRLAQTIMAGADWKAISDLKGSARDRKLGRLMNHVLNNKSGRSIALHPIRPSHSLETEG